MDATVLIAPASFWLGGSAPLIGTRLHDCCYALVPAIHFCFKGQKRFQFSKPPTEKCRDQSEDRLDFILCQKTMATGFGFTRAFHGRGL